MYKAVTHDGLCTTVQYQVAHSYIRRYDSTGKPTESTESFHRRTGGIKTELLDLQTPALGAICISWDSTIRANLGCLGQRVQAREHAVRRGRGGAGIVRARSKRSPGAARSFLLLKKRLLVSFQNFKMSRASVLFQTGHFFVLYFSVSHHYPL